VNSTRSITLITLFNLFYSNLFHCFRIIEQGRIEDRATLQRYSIKIAFNSEEQWTKALKFMLTNLKWGVAWVAAQNSAPEMSWR